MNEPVMYLLCNGYHYQKMKLANQVEKKKLTANHILIMAEKFGK